MTRQPTTIHSLPWEIISNILNLAAEANIAEGHVSKYTYGLSQVTRTLQTQKLHIQKHVTGQLPTDILRWRASDAMRRTCSTWHEWAVGYAFKELYVRRWRGGESWDPKFLALPSPSGGPLTANIFPVIYQDPYCILKSTVALLEAYPSLALNVRKLWFSGIYQYNNLQLVLKIVRACTNLRSLSLPWSALRYGSVDDWVYITNALPRLTSLELLGMSLKTTQIKDDKNIEINYKALEDTRVDFSKIRRLKINGSSNVQSIIDADLWEIARTARNLEQLHITGSSTVSIEGVTALLASSAKSLRVLNYTPYDPETSGTTHLNPSPGLPKIHFCDIITSCHNISDLTVTVPHICEHLFCPPPSYNAEDIYADTNARTPKWRGTAVIRLPASGRTCEHPESPLEHPDSRAQIRSLLDSARTFVTNGNGAVDVELMVGNYTFHPKTYAVAGNFRMAKKIAEGMWVPEGETESRKGPWGSSGVWGDMENRIWTQIGEEDFWDGVCSGLIRFEQ